MTATLRHGSLVITKEVYEKLPPFYQMVVRAVASSREENQ